MNPLKEITKQFNDDPLNVMNQIPYFRDNFNELLFNSYSDLTDYIKTLDQQEVMMILMNSDSALAEHIDLKFLIKDFIDYMRYEFKIPDEVEIDIDDQEIEWQPSEQEVVDDLVSENKHDNKTFITHIEHYMLKNCLVNGGSIFLLLDVVADMYSSKPEIHKIFKTFLYGAVLLTYNQPIERESVLPTLGESKVEISEDSIKIKVKGGNVIVKMVEVVKGLLDIQNERTYPNELDTYTQQYLRTVCNSYYYEAWMWRIFTDVWKRNFDSELTLEDIEKIAEPREEFMSNFK